MHSGGRNPSTPESLGQESNLPHCSVVIPNLTCLAFLVKEKVSLDYSENGPERSSFFVPFLILYVTRKG